MLMLASCLAVADAVEAASTHAEVCAHDRDCSLNGECLAQKCVCDAQWHGERCEYLSLLPVPAGAGYRQPHTSSWGGNAYFDNATGLYHGFFSEFVHHCGLDTWGTNSRIVHTTSKQPAGPYVFVDEALPPQAHNAQISFDPISDTYLLYHIHSPDPSCIGPKYNCSHVCANGTTPPQMRSRSKLRVEAPNSINWTIRSGALAQSKSLSGPWVGVRGDVGCNNPSPFILQNGSVIRVCAGAGYTPFFDRATSFRGPYTTPKINITCSRLAADQNLSKGFHSEDAMVWPDKRGNLHMLSHAITANTEWHDASGVHAFSDDGGFSWQCGEVPPYNGTIVYESGETMFVTKRERPKLLLGEQAQPLVLFTAITQHNHDVDDYSFTLATPIAQ